MINVIVFLDIPDDFAGVNNLRAHGLVVEQYLAATGVVTGTVEEAELQGLLDLGVGKVEVEREVTTQ